MRLRDEVRLGLGAALGFQLLTLVAAIALLSRMAPAIEKVVRENENSISAANEMLLALSLADIDPAAAERFQIALERAKENVTEPGEDILLESIINDAPYAMTGDLRARERVAHASAEIAEINSMAMREQQDEATTLGIGGSWALMALGLLGLVFSLLISRRFNRTITEPIDEIRAVLEACGQGETRRRFHANASSLEFRQVGDIVNRLVDEHFNPRLRAWSELAALERLAINRLLDDYDTPVFLTDRDGQITTASRAGTELLIGSSRNTLKDGLHALGSNRGKDAPPWLQAHDLDGMGWFCRVDPGALGRSIECEAELEAQRKAASTDPQSVTKSVATDSASVTPTAEPTAPAMPSADPAPPSRPSVTEPMSAAAPPPDPAPPDAPPTPQADPPVEARS